MTPEIYTHIGFKTFIESLVTANDNIDAFYRFDLAEITKSASQKVAGSARVIFVLERTEKSTVGNNNSQVHERRTIAFNILKVGQPGDYNGHDQIYDETETIAWSFIDQIEARRDSDLIAGINDIIHVYRNNVAINQIGPWLGGRYGVRVVLQLTTKGRPVLD